MANHLKQPSCKKVLPLKLGRKVMKSKMNGVNANKQHIEACILASLLPFLGTTFYLMTLFHLTLKATFFLQLGCC